MPRKAKNNAARERRQQRPGQPQQYPGFPSLNLRFAQARASRGRARTRECYDRADSVVKARRETGVSLGKKIRKRKVKEKEEKLQKKLLPSRRRDDHILRCQVPHGMDTVQMMVYPYQRMCNDQIEPFMFLCLPCQRFELAIGNKFPVHCQHSCRRVERIGLHQADLFAVGPRSCTGLLVNQIRTKTSISIIGFSHSFPSFS
jgi:hypothetical protein